MTINELTIARIAHIRAASAFYRDCAEKTRWSALAITDDDKRRAQAYDDRAHALAWAADFIEGQQRTVQIAGSRLTDDLERLFAGPRR